MLLHRSTTFFRKVNTCKFPSSSRVTHRVYPCVQDASLAALCYLFLIALLCRQMNLSRTPTGVSRVSRLTFLSQAILDSVSFAGHITFAILTDGRASLSLVAPSFLACVLFVYEAVGFLILR
jgi:transmembrane E3 ubiquitin-protein ligase